MAFAQPVHIYGRWWWRRNQTIQRMKISGEKSLSWPAGNSRYTSLNDEFLQGVFLRVDESVKFCLRPVQGIGFVIPRSLNGFDFLQQHLLGRDEQTINPSPDLQREFIRFHPIFHRKFGEITRRARALDFLVAAKCRRGPGRSRQTHARRRDRLAAGQTQPSRARKLYVGVLKPGHSWLVHVLIDEQHC